jgi:hypothetical protein
LLFVDPSWKDKIEYGAGQGCKIRIPGEYLELKICPIKRYHAKKRPGLRAGG